MLLPHASPASEIIDYSWSACMLVGAMLLLQAPPAFEIIDYGWSARMLVARDSVP